MSVLEDAGRARVAASALGTATRAAKDAGLRAMADALVAGTAESSTPMPRTWRSPRPMAPRTPWWTGWR